MEPLTAHLANAVGAAVAAGGEILDVYRNPIEVTYKDDSSPLTAADQASHALISRRLQTLHPDLPILSEEGRKLDFEQRRSWRKFWLVDPLDGTKEFVKRNGEFTVNIALVRQSQPVLGVVHVPVKDVLYFAASQVGAFRLTGAAAVLSSLAAEPDPAVVVAELIARAQSLPLGRQSGVYTIVGSRSHGSAEFDAFVARQRARHDNIQLIAAGSALKLCLVAEGSADVYPRLGPTMEWDTAAGQAVVELSHGSVVEADSGMPLRYNKQNLLNPWFIVKNEAPE